MWDNQISPRVTVSDKVIAGFAGWLETKMITLHYTLALKAFDRKWRYRMSLSKHFFTGFLLLASSCSSSFGPRGM